MPSERPDGEAIALEDWLRSVHQVLGGAGGAPISEEERTALLDVARVAAHRSERVAAPLTTFLAGVAYGALAPEDRLAALRELVSTLEA